MVWILDVIDELFSIGDNRKIRAERYNELNRFEKPSFRLDLTDICMNCDHCYATSDNPRVATEDEVRLMIDTVEDFVLNSEIDPESREDEDKIDIDFGRTDVMFPGHQNELLERTALALELLKQRGLDNILTKLYTSGMLYKVDAEEFQRIAEEYAKLFQEFVPNSLLTRVSFFMSTGDVFHTAKLGYEDAVSAKQILIDTIKRHSEGIDPQYRYSDHTDRRLVEMGFAGYPEKYKRDGIFVATPRTKRFIDETGFKVNRTCPGIGLSYARDMERLGMDVEKEEVGSGCDRFTLTKDGYITVCYCGTSPIALQGKGSYKRAMHNVQNDPIVRKLAKSGPLGVAELLDKDQEGNLAKALSTYQKYGSCYVCRELLPIMQQHITTLDAQQR